MPGCNQVVLWMVFKDVVPVGHVQVEPLPFPWAELPSPLPASLPPSHSLACLRLSLSLLHTLR